MSHKNSITTMAGSKSLTINSLDKLKRQRKFYRKTAITVCERVTNNIDKLEQWDKQFFMDKLKSTHKRLIELKEEIETHLEYEVEEEENSETTYTNLEYECKINAALTKLQNNTQALTPLSGSLNFNYLDSHEYHNSSIPQMKFSEVNLPEFSDGREENLEDFLNSFETILSQFTLSPNEKFPF